MTNNDIIEQFRAADIGPEPAIQRIDVTAAVGRGRRTIQTRWAIGSSMATATLAASVVAVVALGGSPVNGSGARPWRVGAEGAPPPTSTAGQVVLLRAAANAKKLPAVTARPGQFVYTRTNQWSSESVRVGPCVKVAGEPGCTVTESATFLEGSLHESWRPVETSYSSHIRITEGGPLTPLTPADAERLKKSGRKLNRPVTVREDAGGNGDGPSNPKPDPDPFVNPTVETLKTLPRDPDELLTKVREYAADRGPSRDGQALVVIIDLFREADPLIEPDLREALFRAAAKIPGVDRRPGQANLDGRVGVAIGRFDPQANERQEIIIDPGTSRVVGERTVSLESGDPNATGTVTNWSAVTSYLVNGVKDTKPAT